MSRRNVFLIAALAAGIVIALLLPSFTARAVASGLVVAAVLVLVFRFSQNSNNQSAPSEEERAQDSSRETFGLGKLFEATMSGMREGLLVVDKDMRVVASNAAAHRLFNLSKGKLNTQRLTELTRNPAIYSAFLDALQGSERSGVRIQTHGPERMVFDLRVVPLGHSPNSSDKDSEDAEGALGVFVDITRIERLEQIRQEFLSNVSHELRTPLTAILAFVETLETGALDDKESSQRFLSIIRRNAVRMQDLIDDTLELSAIEAGNVQVRAEQVELFPIVNDIVSSLAVRAADRGIEVTNEVATEATVYADARRLEQMLTNLVENAIKFNRAGGQVKIKCKGGEGIVRSGNERKNRSSESENRDLIVVEDTGEGIPSQHLERLFERFYRVDRARSPEMGGTGLGLAIVKHLARAHGGEVTVTSELGKGSTFTIELPHLR
jgi:two-component system, OmpR family, phosphate regulon sensor histidine kinase PhoR